MAGEVAAPISGYAGNGVSMLNGPSIDSAARIAGTRISARRDA